MSEALSPLDLELAAYSPMELAELGDTVRILLDTANDGTAGQYGEDCWTGPRMPNYGAGCLVSDPGEYGDGL